MEDAPGTPQAPACRDCEWFRMMISRAAWDPQPRADLEALFGAHLRRKHSDGNSDGGDSGSDSTRRLRSV